MKQAIRLGVVLILATMATLADQRPGLIATTRTPLCYCQCERNGGKKMCTKMCELPKYENRWWANSCHKTATEQFKTPQTQHSHSDSHKGARIEQAYLR